MCKLSLAQLIDLNGAVIVTTPGSCNSDASKAGAMFNQVKIPILGLGKYEFFHSPICLIKDIPSLAKAARTKTADSFQSSSSWKNSDDHGCMQSGEAGDPIVHAQKSGPVASAYSEIFLKLETKSQTGNNILLHQKLITTDAQAEALVANT